MLLSVFLSQASVCVYTQIDISHNIILPQDICLRVVYSVISGMRRKVTRYSVQGFEYFTFFISSLTEEKSCILYWASGKHLHLPCVFIFWLRLMGNVVDRGLVYRRHSILGPRWNTIDYCHVLCYFYDVDYCAFHVCIQTLKNVLNQIKNLAEGYLGILLKSPEIFVN